MFHIEPLDLIIQSAIPTVYEKGLSYYEVLNTILQKVNEIVADCNTYFAVDPKNYVENVLMEWYGDGTLAALISDAMPVTDTDGYFTDDTIKGMFKELGSSRAADELQIAADGVNIAALLAKDTNRANFINILDEGVAGDGTDETVAVQTAIDKATAAHALLYIPAGVTIVVSYLLINTKSDFKIVCDGWLKRKNAAVYPDTYNSLFNVVNSSNFEIARLRVDGNVANNGVTLQEHEHCLELSGCSNVKLGEIYGKNLPGDVLYISTTIGLQCDNLYGISSNTGRNTLSIISGSKMQFANIMSIGVGTSAMPGGVDIEPNVIGDNCFDIQFGKLYLEGLGTGMLQLTNNPGAIVRDITVDSVKVMKSVRIEGSGLRIGIGINKVDNVKIKAAVIRQNTNTDSEKTMTGVFIDGGDNVDINVDIENVGIGIRMGFNTAARNIRISGSIHYCMSQGVDIANVSNVLFDGLLIEDCDVSAGNNAHIVFNVGITASHLLFKDCNFIKTSHGFNIAWLDGTLTDVKFIDCMSSGWSHHPFGGDPGVDADIWRINCENVNFSNAMPTGGYWREGEYVINTEPDILGTSGSFYVIKGWYRLTSNTNNVLNQDWIADKVLTGT